MAMYLLPCSCGRSIKIIPQDAGRPIPCECGQTVQAPSMRDILQLAQAPEPTQASGSGSGSTWGRKHQFATLGLILAIAGAGLSSWMALTLPPRPTIEQDYLNAFEAEFEVMTPNQAFESYMRMTEMGLPKTTPADFEDYQQALEQRKLESIMAAVVAGFALLMTIGAYFIPTRQTSAGSDS